MQTLTTPAAITKRKQACSSCRHRKKRCDGERPSCSLCRKWGIQCEYIVPAAERAQKSIQYAPFPDDFFTSVPTMDFVSNDYFDMFPFPEMQTDDIGPAASMDNTNVDVFEYATSASDSTTVPVNRSIDTVAAVPFETRLPPEGILIELIDLFFEHSYHVFPCFHRKSFLSCVQQYLAKCECTMLLNAMCAIAAPHHYDAAVRSQQREWFELAKREYEETMRFPKCPTRALQAALCIVSHSYTVGDFSTAWLVLGKSWRQICALGHNRLDMEEGMIYGLPNTRPQTALELEELRRALWLLFMMDREHTWPVGWPHAIEEKSFKVDIPIADEIFQGMTLEAIIEDIANGSQSTCEDAKPTPFTRSLNSLIDSRPVPTDTINVFHYTVLAHILLGRVTETVHSIHGAPDPQECTTLEHYLTKLRLSLPRAATTLLDATPNDRGQIIWLWTTINTTAIVLHYRSASTLSSKEAKEQFTCAFIAAKRTVQIVKEASRISIELLLSPHIGASLYVAACVLIIHWRTTHEDAIKEDIDIISLVFDRMYEVYSFLGMKFKLALEHDLQQDTDGIVGLRAKGLKGLLSDCCKWSWVKEAFIARKVHVDIT